jgi:hypothetical protein
VKYYRSYVVGTLKVIQNFWRKKNNLKEAEPEIEIKNTNPRFRGFLPRGGVMVELSGISITVIAKVAIKFLAENRLLAGLFTGSGMALSNISTSALDTYLRDAFAQNLLELERQKFILVDGEKLYLDQCDQNIQYLFMVLKDPRLPFEEKEKITRSILTKYLNLKTADGRVNFVLCIVFILYIFSTRITSSYYVVLKNLIKAIKEGRISKIVGRAIIRKLKKGGLPIDPKLLEVINS